MRIACVHIPQFALQCATRIDPSLRRSESAVVVVGPASLPEAWSLLGTSPATTAAANPASRASHASHASRATTAATFAATATTSLKSSAPVVLACSRAAWALGARVGMTATAARSLSPLIEVVTADAQLERDTVRAIADVLLSLSPVVDVGGRVGPGRAHLALYCEVPAKTRGTSYGDRLLERLEALGLMARIGIADDRFTAWVAAWLGAWDAHDRASTAASPTRHDETGVVSVPRGGSAAFLAPRPLSLLAISPEVQHMLEALGVRTLGEFAALPAPTVSSRAARFEADYQALARGDSGNVLRPYAPDAPIREEAVLHAHRADAPAITTATATAATATSTTTTTATATTATATATATATNNAVGGVHVHEAGLSAPAAVALLAERVAMRLAGRARCAARLDITIGGAAGERVVTVAPVREGQGVLASAEQIADAIGSALGTDSTLQAWRLRVVVSGEALAGDVREDDAVPALATQRTFALVVAGTSANSNPHVNASPNGYANASPNGYANASPNVYANASPNVYANASPNTDTHADANANAGTNAHSDANTNVNANAGSSARPDVRTRVAHVPKSDQRSTPNAVFSDPDVALSIALSTTGSAVDRMFGLTSPVSTTFASGERRESHRRTRRGKQRRRAELTSMVQPRLFKM